MHTIGVWLASVYLYPGLASRFSSIVYSIRLVHLTVWKDHGLERSRFGKHVFRSDHKFAVDLTVALSRRLISVLRPVNSTSSIQLWAGWENCGHVGKTVAN